MAVEDLPDENLETYAETALVQSADLMYIATGLLDDPTDPQHLRILQNGIMGMAEFLISTQPFRGEAYAPVSSESLGSYSYSKSAGAVKAGIPTEVMWFDLAVHFFSSGDESALALTSSTSVFEYDGGLLHQDIEGRRSVVGPAALLGKTYKRPFG